ncbi:hypothetical protein SAMN04487897_11120 [Paenibacillus sp. yr247]|nr:hypothetical protein SAMN04487897_11120 [Paenibacillus sp. yr247]
MWLTCPRKGTSNTPLRTPTCESGFEAPKPDGIGGFLCVYLGEYKEDIMKLKKAVEQVLCLINRFWVINDQLNRLADERYFEVCHKDCDKFDSRPHIVSDYQHLGLCDP